MVKITAAGINTWDGVLKYTASAAATMRQSDVSNASETVSTTEDTGMCMFTVLRSAILNPLLPFSDV